MRLRDRYRRAALVALVAALLSLPGSGRADSIDRLAATLRASGSEKARISAALALAKLQDRRGVPALAHALRDRSRSVRAIAATALGKIGDRRALKALRRAAKTDSDALVKSRAAAAIRRIEGGKRADRPRKRRGKLARYRVAARERPRLDAAEPRMHVVLQSAADETTGQIRRVIRKRRARRMQRLMMEELRRTRLITVEPEEAAELELDSFSVDLTLVKLDRQNRGSMVEIECQIRITVSNAEGKMLSFLTGGAKVQVPRRTYRPRYAPVMRREALENAVRKVHRDLVAFLQQRKD